MLMALWGRFPFGINTAAFQELSRDTSWRWPGQELFGQMPALQFVGPGDDTITLPGVIYPEFRGGTKQIQDMRDLASNGTPELLLDGRGNILGKWVCTNISEVQSTFAGFGIPLKQEFTITLRRVPDPLSGNIIANLIGKKLGVDVSGAMRMINQVRSMAGQIQTAVATAKSLVQTASAVIGAPAALIISTVDKAARIGEQIKDLCDDATDIAGSRPTVASARSALQIISGGMPTLAAQSTGYSNVLADAVETVIAAATPIEGVIAARAAQVATNKLSRFSAVTHHETKDAAAELPES
jgi:phage protein U